MTAVRSQTSANQRQRDVAARGRQLEVAEAYEGRRDPAHDRPGLGSWPSVVEHVANHVFAGGDEAQRARGRHAEVVHRLAHQELAHRRAQHRAAVGAARVRRRSGALQLQLEALAAGADRLAQRDRAPVAQLAGPVAELVAAVVRGKGLAARDQHVAGHCLRERRRGHVRLRQSEQVRTLARPGDEPRCGDRGRPHAGVERAVHLTPAGLLRGVGRQLADEAVVEAQRWHGVPHGSFHSIDGQGTPRFHARGGSRACARRPPRHRPGPCERLWRRSDASRARRRQKPPRRHRWPANCFRLVQVRRLTR